VGEVCRTRVFRREILRSFEKQVSPIPLLLWLDAPKTKSEKRKSLVAMAISDSLVHNADVCCVIRKILLCWQSARLRSGNNRARCICQLSEYLQEVTADIAQSQLSTQPRFALNLHRNKFYLDGFVHRDHINA
jgi:hypothetical protein